MSAFDPDAYLAEEDAGFDPDAYLAAEDAPGTLESLGRGTAQGGTLGFADEMAGAARAVGSALLGKSGTVKENYVAGRDESRERYAAAEEANPGAFTTGQVAGGIGTALVPGLGPAKGLAGAVKVGAGLGAAQGLGSSEADLTEGEVGEAARDAAAGGVLGAAGGALGHGISRLVGGVASRLAGRSARGAAEAEAEEAAKQGLKQAQREASALGKYRSSVQSASRDLEVLGREAKELPEGTVQRQASEFLESPQGVAVREQVAANKLTTAPERISEMAQLRAEHGALVAARDSLVKQATEDALKDPLRRQFAPRIATLGHRLIPAALAGAGGLIGGPEGAAAGAGLGGVMALTQGRPGIILRNLVRSPAARRAMWAFVREAATIRPEALGRFGAAIAGALRQGNERLAAALHEQAMDSDEQYQSGILGLLEQPEESGTVPAAGGAE